MNLVQLDEDINAAHIVNACAKEGKVFALRLPNALRGALDPEVLSALLPLGNPILTLDLGFAESHLEFVSDKHGGIIILAADDDELTTMTTHSAQRMLFQLKRDIPSWHNLDVSNSILTVRRSRIEVCHCESRELLVDITVDRASVDWQAAFCSAIAANTLL